MAMHLERLPHLQVKKAGSLIRTPEAHMAVIEDKLVDRRPGRRLVVLAVVALALIVAAMLIATRMTQDDGVSRSTLHKQGEVAIAFYTAVVSGNPGSAFDYLSTGGRTNGDNSGRSWLMTREEYASYRTGPGFGAPVKTATVASVQQQTSIFAAVTLDVIRQDGVNHQAVVQVEKEKNVWKVRQFRTL